MSFTPLPTLGQALMAASLPVVIASNQSAISVKGDVGTLDQLDLTNSDPLAVAIVDGSGTQITSFGGGTQYAEDAAHVSGDIGTMMLAVRKDTVGTLAGATGDYAPIQVADNGGVRLTSISSEGTTFASEDTLQLIQGNTQLLDDSLYAEDSAHVSGNRGIMALAVRNSAIATLTSTDGDYSPVAVDSAGRVFIIGQANHDSAVSGQPVTIGAVASAAAPTDVSADQDSVRLWALRNGALATQITAAGALIPGDATNGLDVDVTRSALPTGASTSANQTTIIGHVDGIETLLTTISGDTTDIEAAIELMDDVVFADDAAVTLGTSKGNITVGVAVQTDGTDPTAVSAEGDAAALRTDMNRILLVNETHPRFWHASVDYASAQTNASIKTAPGASLSLYITDISISNGAVAGNITLLDGSGGTVLYEIYPAINGGATLSLRSPIKLTANTALCITSTTVTTHSVFVSGYIAP